ncbi:hybrid sensor histidine kinase/response regulator [Oxalobacteraceae bacterium]|nr:hybrid sensor histidine kinase/response regulator [Oxalobacteraceae bacterium]
MPRDDVGGNRGNRGELAELHGDEVARLGGLIAQLLQDVDVLQKRQSGMPQLENHVLQLREANENLVRATFGAQDLQAVAEAATRRQTEFLSMLAHELRNPLQPIALANDLLGKLTGSHPELPRLQGIIDRQVQHLARLVNDLLDASRVTSGKLVLQNGPVRLAEMLEIAIETSQPSLDRRRQTVTVELPEQPIVIKGDLVRLAQVFTNLLINASKFSPEGEHISVHVSTHGQAARILVRDHGMGISAAMQPFIFDLFTQGERSMERAQGGLGIGLSLVRSVVELHGGTVAVSSAGAGCGSEFAVLLPMEFERASPPVPATVSAQPAKSCKILLVEDNPDANETLRLLLVLSGHEVKACFNGVSAAAEALLCQYDFVISDIGLPGMDGYELVQEIRAHASGRLPYFIATSGYQQDIQRARAIDCGFDHYLVKPLAIDVLLALIEHHAH